MLTKIREKIGRWITPGVDGDSGTLAIVPGRAVNVRDLRSRQSHPAQKSEIYNLYAPSVDLVPFMAQYALNHWVYTAIDRIAPRAASAPFYILSRDGMENVVSHGLLDLLGRFGRPNDNQDSFEFFEKHFQSMIMAGNVYWLWECPSSTGAPTAVYQLEPENIKIIPGKNRTIARYDYWYQGRVTPFHPERITHFKKANPYSRYYGLSALQVLYLTIISDNSMLTWNYDFFDDELGIPSGIMIVPSDTSDAEIERIRAEFTAQHGEGRRVAFIKSDAGKAVWLDAGLKHKDYDFKNGRVLNRQSVYEGIGLPLGIMSETSTEAHAIVAERQLSENVRTWHVRTTRKLNVDGLDFWPSQQNLQTDFEDVRKKAVDWRREKDRILSDSLILSLDEMRMREYNLQPLSDGQVPVAQMKPEKNGENDASEDDFGKNGGGNRET